jgi:hypothetical protein
MIPILEKYPFEWDNTIYKRVTSKCSSYVFDKFSIHSSMEIDIEEDLIVDTRLVKTVIGSEAGQYVTVREIGRLQMDPKYTFREYGYHAGVMGTLTQSRPL